MKKIFLFCMAFALSGIVMAHATNVTDTLTVRIKGMRCEECAHKVGTLLKKDKAVGHLSFDLEKRTVAIEYDAQKVSADTLKARLAATGRYKSSPYDKNEVIRRGMGLQMADMHCQNCANRITKRLQQLEGIDSIAPHVDKHYVFVRYNANKTTKANIRQILKDMGFTPVNYYTSKSISFAYFNIPAEKATEETTEIALAIDGVDDANVNARRGSLAITYLNTETSEERLQEALKEEGIEAVVPPAHQCKEKQEAGKENCDKQ